MEDYRDKSWDDRIDRGYIPLTPVLPDDIPIIPVEEPHISPDSPISDEE